MIKVDISPLNEMFNIQGEDTMMFDENYERTNLPGKHIGWGPDHRHTEESKELIGSYHKGKVVSEETKRKISQSSKGQRRPNNGGYGERNVNSKVWRIYHECGRISELTGISNWCKENGYNKGCISFVRDGKRNHHKDIIKVEMFEKYC